MMVRAIALVCCLLLLAALSWGQLVIDNCTLQPYARCPGVNLYGAFLAEVNLQGSYLKGANLKNSNLTNASLIDAYLYEADLNGAILTEADFSRAIWVDGRVCAFGSIGNCK